MHTYIINATPKRDIENFTAQLASVCVTVGKINKWFRKKSENNEIIDERVVRTITQINAALR